MVSSVINMRSVVAVFAVLCISVYANPDYSAEEEFVQASQKLAVLTGAGKSAEACIEGGKTAINEVIKEKNNAQKVLNGMPNGSKCQYKRAREVKEAQARVNANQMALSKAARELQKNLRKKVTVALSFEKAKRKCGVLYSTAAWKKHSNLVKKLTRIKTSAKARLSAAKSSLSIALRDQRLAQCKCKRQVIKNANSALATAKRLTAGRKATIRRELLLICLAKYQGKKNGAGMTQCKNQGLPSKYNSVLALHRTKLIKWNNRFKCNAFRGPGHRKTNDKCKGFFIPKSCKGTIAFSLRTNNRWSKYQTYQCPLGWKWASSTEYRNQVSRVRRSGGRCNGYAYYGRCGWGGYPTPNKYYFRFRDSRYNGRYQHAGRYIGDWSSVAWSTTGNNAGIVCLRKRL